MPVKPGNLLDLPLFCVVTVQMSHKEKKKSEIVFQYYADYLESKLKNPSIPPFWNL